MTTRTKLATGLAVMAALTTTSVRAQTPTAKPVLPVKIGIVIERYSSDNKKISSMPFVVWLATPASRPTNGSLRVGVDVPIGSNTETDTKNHPDASSTSTTATRLEYKNIGTSIDCYLSVPADETANIGSPTGPSKYMLQLTLTDTSIFDPDAQRKADLVAKGVMASQTQRPVDGSAFRTFSVSNSLPVRDGQTVEFATATDKVTGEIVKVLVTVTIEK